MITIYQYCAIPLIKDNHFVTTRVSPFTGNKYQDGNIDPIHFNNTRFM